MYNLLDTIDKYQNLTDLLELRIEVAKDAREAYYKIKEKDDYYNFVMCFDFFLNHSNWNTRPASLYPFMVSICDVQAVDPYTIMLGIVKKFRTFD